MKHEELMRILNGWVYGTKTKTKMQRFIVAEITKNWLNTTPATDLLCQKFETVINFNAERGYKLIDWKISSTQNDTLLTETIIAIFELKENEKEEKN